MRGYLCFSYSHSYLNIARYARSQSRVHGWYFSLRIRSRAILDAIEYHHQQPPHKTRTPPPCVSSSPMANPESSVGKRSQASELPICGTSTCC
uniref:Uncharacterized protein n=1 Tax=Tanacetum cinerariifolium TaxID=118510 RepID=A0A699HWY7_TANCI|nr:hypothetical protein [Tanacetum cinerariifolium]